MFISQEADSMELYQGGKFAVTVGDITKLEVDAIVNSTNPGFVRGFGVDHAIHEAAGPELEKATAGLGHASFGEARITAGFELPAKHVIHVVSPVWKDGHKGEEAQLEKAYREALGVAASNDVKTVAFPAISTGTYAFPIENATRIALTTTKAFVDEQPDRFTQVIFCAYNARDGEVYNRLARSILG
jgi:O-acetyl-ADP-ribose deacetylase (regulator of RNase III)